MENRFLERLISYYSDGRSIDHIAWKLKTTEEDVLKTLRFYCNEQREKRTFSEDFKKVLADRDLTGIARTTIASEMGINVNTVKKSCEQYGQQSKEVASSEKTYTKIEGVFPRDKCVECKSERYNEVGEDTYYCYKCGNEYIHRKTHVLRVNWEYID